jgi:hypothetical protein
MKKLATATTMERIAKYVNAYFFSTSYRLEPKEYGWHVVGGNGIMPNYEVVPYRGGFKFRQL